MGDIILYIDP